MASNVIPFPAPVVTNDLHAPFAKGIEANSPLIEIRLALAFYWQHHSKDEWRLHMPITGRAS